MRAYKTTREALAEAACQVGVVAEIEKLGGRVGTYRVKLYPLADKAKRKYQRYSTDGKGRKVHAVCWHGFRDFFRAVYSITPDAIFVTASARYEGRDGFERSFEATGDKNIGSYMSPMLYRDACGCESDLRTATVRVMKQSDIQHCPHFILVPDHYRQDGSCKCNDPAESVMKEWGYEWNAKAKQWTSPETEQV